MSPSSTITATIRPLTSATQLSRAGTIRYRMVPARESWVAEVSGRIVAVMVLDGDMVEQFYVSPGQQRRGVGDAMLAHAKQLRPAGLRLWTFQRNTPARRFYEARGFIAKESTGGATNMEREPDVLYAWTPCTERLSGL